MRFTNASGLSTAAVKRGATTLQPYLASIRRVVASGGYDASESSVNLPSDASLLREVLHLKKTLVTSELRYVVVIGIGGSNLGTKAIYDALAGFFDGMAPKRVPKILFADTTHPEFLTAFESLLAHDVHSLNHILVNAISKSGGTTETMANTEVLMQMLVKRFGAAALKRLVVTTDVGSSLWNLAAEKEIARFGIPSVVGGRYSVFSAVGLFPLAAAGIDVAALCKGATRMRDQCLDTHPDRNPALASAISLQAFSKKGKRIHDTFLFQPELESLGKWYRQLLGESVGKEKNLNGKTVHAGITPTVSIGSTDLHSVGQLYLGGPKDKITTFVWVERSKKDHRVPSAELFPLIKGIRGASLSTITRAILEGVKIAYQKKRLPYMEVALPNISPESLGEFMQFKMMEIMYLSKLCKVNAFDQPNVELYKKETKRLLTMHHG